MSARQAYGCVRMISQWSSASVAPRYVRRCNGWASKASSSTCPIVVRVCEWSREDLGETFELRAALEGLGARRAAARASASDVARLRALCATMEQTIQPGGPRDLDALTTQNRKFHDDLLALSASAQLTAMVHTVVHVPLVMRTFHQYSDHALARSQHHHREICDALEHGDGEWAESVMRSHVFAARTFLDHSTPALVQEDPR